MQIQSTPVQESKITGPPAESLLFKPCTSQTHGTMEFECIFVPFLFKDGRMFVLYFIDGCGDLSVYIKCYAQDPKEPLGSYMDGTADMKACLEMQELTGVEYYFGKLNKAVQNYLYALQLFVDKEIMSADTALSLIETLGFNPDRMRAEAEHVEQMLETAKERRAKRLGIRDEQPPIGNAVMDFINTILGLDKNEGDENGEFNEDL